jgi:hypothetical protein
MSTEPDPFGSPEVPVKAGYAQVMKQESEAEAVADLVRWHTEKGLRFIQADEEPKPVDWMVDGIMTFDGIALLTAKSKVGKSSLTYDLAIAGATGTGSIRTPEGGWLFDFKGKAVKTYYLDTENNNSLSLRRLDSLCKEKGVSRREVLGSGDLLMTCLETKTPPWINPGDNLEQTIDKAGRFGEMLGNAGVRFIVLDVASHCYPEDDQRDENDRAFVANFFKVINAMRARARACVLIVHHQRKGASEHGNEMASGSGQWLRTPTTLISVNKLPKDGNPDGDLHEIIVEGRETKGFRKNLRARGTEGGVCRTFDQVEEPVKEKKPPGRQAGDRRKIAEAILDAVLFKDPGVLERQIKPGEWLELVSRVNQAEPEWQKTPETLKAYLTEELVSAGRVKVISKTKGFYQIMQ